MSTSDVVQPVVVRKRGTILLMVSGLALVIAGAACYAMLMGNTFVRTTGVPALPLMAIGSVLALAAIVRRPGVVTGLGGVLAFGMTGLLAFFLFGMRLPATAAVPAIGSLAPDFTLSAHDGRTVRLADYRGQGPVLLIFYRGFW